MCYRYAVVSLWILLDVKQRFVCRLDSVFVHLLFYQTVSTIEVQDAQDLVSLLVLFVSERLLLLLRHILEDGNAARVKRLCI